MTLKITIKLGNQAFEDGGPEEVKRILVDLCERLPEPLAKTDAINLRDVNGHTVGTAKIK